MSGGRPELAPIAFLSAISLVLPLPWHWRIGNPATISIIVWLFVINVIYGVDAVIWANSVTNKFPIWCDISTKLIIESTTALPAAGMCVCIRLYNACAARGKPSGKNPRNVIILEYGVCYAMPILFMALHYIVQGHRFDIIENIGCRPTTFVSVPGIVLVFAPPVVLAVIALIYGGLALVQIYKHYNVFLSHITSGQSTGNLSFGHYTRLMILAVAQIVWTTSVSTACLAFNLSQNPIYKYVSWEDVHLNFSRVNLIPWDFIPPRASLFLLLSWYIIPVSTLIFVSLFSFGKDSIQGYCRRIRWIYIWSGLRWFVQHVADNVKGYNRPGPTGKHTSRLLTPI